VTILGRTDADGPCKVSLNDRGSRQRQSCCSYTGRARRGENIRRIDSILTLEVPEVVIFGYRRPVCRIQHLVQAGGFALELLLGFDGCTR